MKATTKVFWKAISKQCDLLSKGNIRLYVDEKKENEYITACDIAYRNCKKRVMAKSVENLDRHKVAAILVIEGLRLEIIKAESVQDNSNKLFIGCEKVLVSCAISYLAQQINEIIEKDTKNQIQRMKGFYLPVAFSCKTNYVDILSRILHYGKVENTLSLLDLADKFFLIEYIAIREFYQNDAEKVYTILREVTQ